MTRHTRPVSPAWEQQDAFTGWRKVMFWQRGELRKIKRRAAKADRREARRQARDYQAP